jgi:hypothetical protein
MVDHTSPNTDILKIDNFIKQLLQVEDDIQMQEMLFGKGPSATKGIKGRKR